MITSINSDKSFDIFQFPFYIKETLKKIKETLKKTRNKKGTFSVS